MSLLPGGDHRGCERVSWAGERQALLLECRISAFLRLQVGAIINMGWACNLIEAFAFVYFTNNSRSVTSVGLATVYVTMLILV